MFALLDSVTYLKSTLWHSRVWMTGSSLVRTLPSSCLIFCGCSVSSHQRANAERLRIAKAQLYAVLPSGVHPTAQELSEASGLTLGLVAQAELVERMLAMGSRSFEAPLLDNDGEASGSLQELAAQVGLWRGLRWNHSLR